ncbi:MAG TPA: hypothetical protein VM093_04910 [Aeromicrobium sp.]|nr:hypothetical protein [Aeromicrobium sp.]
MPDSTPREPAETDEERRRREVLDLDLEPRGDDDQFDDQWDGYAGDQREGRLIAPDEVVREDVDPEAVAHGVTVDDDVVSTDDAAIQEGDQGPGIRG